MKIYTKTGDDGTTGLLGKGRVPKDDPRIDAYGTVDELNAVIGLARSGPLDPAIDADLKRIQDDLFAVGSALADPDPDGRFFAAVGPDRVRWLEDWIDRLEETLPPLAHFILPGGSPAASHAHHARTVCRRAERLVVHLTRYEGGAVAPELPVYLNRLGDALFVVARALNARAGVADVRWEGL